MTRFQSLTCSSVEEWAPGDPLSIAWRVEWSPGALTPAPLQRVAVPRVTPAHRAPEDLAEEDRLAQSLGAHVERAAGLRRRRRGRGVVRVLDRLERVEGAD